MPETQALLDLITRTQKIGICLPGKVIHSPFLTIEDKIYRKRPVEILLDGKG
jgi:hypothetical protein